MAVGNGYTLMANPFDDGNGNQLTNVLTGAFANKSQVVTWNGTSFNTGIGKVTGGWASSVALPPGEGFFVLNSSPTPVTNTFVGSVVVASSSSITNSIASGFSAVGSPVPYTGDATTDTNINLGGSLANKSQLISWNTGSQQYNTAVGKSGSGWGGSFNISVGQGFFINTPVSGSNWVQTLNP